MNRGLVKSVMTYLLDEMAELLGKGYSVGSAKVYVKASEENFPS